MLGWSARCAHRIRENIRENMRVGAPITLEPGPNSTSFPQQLYLGPGFATPLEGKCRPLEAILRRFSAFLGSWDQQRASGPLAGSGQRSPFAVVARHWLICGPTFLLRVGGRSGLKGKGRCRSPSKKAPPTTMKSDDLWVGLQVEEPGTV
jgi:hypothetical protein